MWAGPRTMTIVGFILLILKGRLQPVEAPLLESPLPTTKVRIGVAVAAPNEWLNVKEGRYEDGAKTDIPDPYEWSLH